MKSRALETVITKSRILDGDGGTGSSSADLPNGGRAVLRGGVIQRSAASRNPDIVHFGGASGRDELSGGPGADTFVVGAREERRDTILDFNPAEGDRLDLSGVCARVSHRADTEGLLDQHFVTRSDRPAGVLVKVDLKGDGPAADGVPLASLQALRVSGLTGDVLIG